MTIDIKKLKQDNNEDMKRLVQLQELEREIFLKITEANKPLNNFLKLEQNIKDDIVKVVELKKKLEMAKIPWYRFDLHINLFIKKINLITQDKRLKQNLLTQDFERRAWEEGSKDKINVLNGRLDTIRYKKTEMKRVVDDRQFKLDNPELSDSLDALRAEENRLITELKDVEKDYKSSTQRTTTLLTSRLSKEDLQTYTSLMRNHKIEHLGAGILDKEFPPDQQQALQRSFKKRLSILETVGNDLGLIRKKLRDLKENRDLTGQSEQTTKRKMTPSLANAIQGIDLTAFLPYPHDKETKLPSLPEGNKDKEDEGESNSFTK